DVALARDLAMPRVELVDRHVQRAGDDRRLGLEVDPVAHVDDDHVLAAVELALELFRRDPRDVDLPQKAPAADVLPADVAADRPSPESQGPATELVEEFGHHLQLRAEDPAEHEVGAAPDRARERAEDEEVPDRHLYDPGQRRRD